MSRSSLASTRAFRARTATVVALMTLAALRTAAAAPPLGPDRGPAVSSAPASAAPAATSENAATREAREAFVQATALAARAEWAEALASFERSLELRPHPVTVYNIGFCQRALGSYTLARDAFERALADDVAGGGAQLPTLLETEARGYIAEIDRLLATATLTVAPLGALVTIDGRPLQPRATGGSTVYVAGVRSPGPGEPVPEAPFKVVLNPGFHLLSFTRTGFSPAIDRRTLAPGSTSELTFALDRLPATLHIESNQEGSIVTVSGVDVGAAPVDVSRPSGGYKVAVRKRGWKPFEADVVLQPGEDLEVRARLIEDRPGLVERWWFWSAVGAVVLGASVGTYELTRPAPQRPAPVAGGLNWVVSTP